MGIQRAERNPLTLTSQSHVYITIREQIKLVTDALNSSVLIPNPSPIPRIEVGIELNSISIPGLMSTLGVYINYK